MSGIFITLDQLRGMIGQHVRHEGLQCEVIEVLEDGPSLVLASLGESSIQIDQFGNPSRRVPQTFTVPVLTSNRIEIHPAWPAASQRATRSRSSGVSTPCPGGRGVALTWMRTP